MKKFYEKFFYIPKHGKIRESVMLARVATTVIISLMCLAAMGLTAYAYFSCNVTSGSNIIHSAKFTTSLSVEAVPSGGARSVEAPTVNTVEGKHTVSLAPDALYKITLSRAADCSAGTGYIFVSADGCQDNYHTQQLGADGDETTQEISFLMSVSNAATVTFEERWGTSSYYADYKQNGDTNELYITQNESIVLSVAVPSGGNVLSETIQTEVNTQETDPPDPEAEDNQTAPDTETSPEANSENTEAQQAEQPDTAESGDNSDASAQTEVAE